MALREGLPHQHCQCCWDNQAIFFFFFLLPVVTGNKFTLSMASLRNTYWNYLIKVGDIASIKEINGGLDIAKISTESYEVCWCPFIYYCYNQLTRPWDLSPRHSFQFEAQSSAMCLASCHLLEEISLTITTSSPNICFNLQNGCTLIYSVGGNTSLIVCDVYSLIYYVNSCEYFDYR